MTTSDRLNSGGFSVFPRGYINKMGRAVLSVQPRGVMTVADAYGYIVGPAARDATLGLRALIAQRAVADAPTRQEEDAEQEYKKLRFEVATFGGVFSYRKASALAADSGLRTVDIDELPSEAEARALQARLVADRRLVTALCFLSPRGRGVKWVVQLPDRWRMLDAKAQYAELMKYVLFEYGVVADRSGSDISRACYLPYDPHCYVGPQFLTPQNIPSL